MRVVARRTLWAFVASLAGRKEQRAVESALDAWFYEVRRAEWVSAADVKALYARASIINAERVVFDIKGNDYRLVAAVDYEQGIVWIKWIGDHRAYDKIDAAKVEHGD
jgi:mRNA interferase HigB